jgi:hypothetical protein
VSDFREMAESEEMRQVREAYALLDSELHAAADASGTVLSLETRFKVTAAMMACRRAIFGSLLPPEMQHVVPTPEDIETAYLERKVVPLRRP